MEKQKPKKNFRKRTLDDDNNDDDARQQLNNQHHEDDEDESRMALEEVKFLQKQRERKSGIPALPTSSSSATTSLASPFAANSLNKKKSSNKDAAYRPTPDRTDAPDAEKDDLALIKDTFAQETAVMVEDPNMIKYIEQELAKKRGKNTETTEEADNDLKSAEDELYKIPDHLKVKRRNALETSTQWTTGIAEVQLPIEYKLRNIEETEAAKKLLQEKRLMGRTKSEFNIPSSFSADYFQRGRDYAEKLRRDHPELYKDRTSQDNVTGPRETDSGTDAAGQRLAATDEFMLERFRKRERQRVMRR